MKREDVKPDPLGKGRPQNKARAWRVRIHLLRGRLRCVERHHSFSLLIGSPGDALPSASLREAPHTQERKWDGEERMPRTPGVRGPGPKFYCCGSVTLGGSLNISVKPRGSTRVGNQTAAETGTETWAGRLTFGVCSWPAACVFPIKSSVSWSPRLWAEPDELQGTGLLGLHHNVCVLMPGVWWVGTKCCVYLFFFNFYFLLRCTW